MFSPQGVLLPHMWSETWSHRLPRALFYLLTSGSFFFFLIFQAISVVLDRMRAHMPRAKATNPVLPQTLHGFLQTQLQRPAALFNLLDFY